MTPPQFPTDESLQGGIGFIDERAAAGLAKLARLVEIERLIVVEQVTLAVVRCRAARLLVAELRAPLDRQRLIQNRTPRVSERIAIIQPETRKPNGT